LDECLEWVSLSAERSKRERGRGRARERAGAVVVVVVVSPSGGGKPAKRVEGLAPPTRASESGDFTHSSGIWENPAE